RKYYPTLPASPSGASRVSSPANPRPRALAVDATSRPTVDHAATDHRVTTRGQERMGRTIHEVSRMTGLTSRTLRHYDAIGLLPPSSTSPNGMRSYDDDALVRLQRILVLRDLGLGLDAITQALDLDRPSTTAALRQHVAQLETARARVDRQIAAVQRTDRKSTR